MNKDAFMDAMFKLSTAIKEIAIAVVDDTGDSIPIETFPNTDITINTDDAGNPADLAPAWTIPGAMTPWDERIHVGAKTKMAKAPNQWKKKKGGVSDEFLAQVEQEIAVRPDQGTQQPGVSFQQPMPQQPMGMPQQPMPQQPVHQQPMPQQPVHQQPMPQQPVHQQPMPQQPGAGLQSQVPGAGLQSQVPGAGLQSQVPGTVFNGEPGGVIPSFDEVMNLLSSLSAKNKLNSDLINSLIQQAGGTSLQDVNNNPQCRVNFHQLLKGYDQ